MKESQESVNLRREQLQNDLDAEDDIMSDEQFVDMLNNLSNDNTHKVYTFMKFMETLFGTKKPSVDEHINILFNQQKESVKETGKMCSPENIKKALETFYEEKKKTEIDKNEQSEYFKKLNVFEVYCSVCNKSIEIKTYENYPLLLLKEPWHTIGKKVYCSDECWAKDRISHILISTIGTIDRSKCNKKLKILQKILNDQIEELIDPKLKGKSNEMGM